MIEGKKIYFASDFHLGSPSHEESLVREKKLVRWLDSIKNQAEEIYLVGDLFDFWFEYKTVIPKGYVRILGKLAELRDSGIPIHFFVGNHDLWMFGYFEKELGIPVHFDPIVKQLGNKIFMIGHGDGIGPKDYGYKFIKKIFTNPFCQWLFHRLHPNFGIWLAKIWSRQSRLSNNDNEFLGEDDEWQIVYAKERLKKEKIDYFIFGHRHLTIEHPLENGTRFINLGDWITNFSYAEFDGENLQLKFYEKD